MVNICSLKYEATCLQSQRRKNPDKKIPNFMLNLKYGKKSERSGVMLIGEGCFGLGSKEGIKMGYISKRQENLARGSTDRNFDIKERLNESPFLKTFVYKKGKEGLVRTDPTRVLY